MEVIEKDVEFTPLDDFLLIEVIPRGETAGGIALPEGSCADEPTRGKVLKVGPGHTTEEGVVIPPNVQAGEVVYLFFAYHKPVEITLQGKKFLVARCRDLIGVAA